MEKNIRHKFGPVFLKRMELYCFLFAFIVIPLICLFLSSNSVYGYGPDSGWVDTLDYIYPNPMAGNVINESIDGHVAYIAYWDDSDGAGGGYSVAAIDLSDPVKTKIIWTLSIPDCIEDLFMEGPLLYIVTATRGLLAIDVDEPAAPILQNFDPSQQIQPKRRFLYYDGLNQYTSLFSTFNLPSYNAGIQYPTGFQSLTAYNPYQSTFPLTTSTSPWTIGSIGSIGSLGLLGSLGSVYMSPVNYQVPAWSQTNLWTGAYGLQNNIFSYSMPQTTLPYISPIGFSGQYTGFSSQLGMTIPQLPGFPWSFGGQAYPWQMPAQQTTTGSGAARYRSPVSVRLSLNNTSGRPLQGEISLTLKDLDGKTVSVQRQALSLDKGIGTYHLSLNKVPEKTGPDDFAKYNVSYSFIGEGVILSGQKSLFQVADKMEARIVGPDSLYSGDTTTIGVHAFVHGQPLAINGADVTVDLIMGGQSSRLYKGVTDESGFSETTLDIPEGVIGSGKLLARVSSDLGTEEITEDIEIIRIYKLLLTTDKPLYQPGQVIHIRTLALKKPDLVPQEDKEIIFECEDPKGNKVFRVDTKSDSFGVASVDFTLGTDINQGLYTLRAILTEGGAPTTSEKKVTVERYVLPKFKVDLVTDADYYSPGDTVHGTIHAYYFFGKDLSQATVTIDASKFDVEFDLFQSIGGKTDDEGIFDFDLILPSYFVGLPLEQGQAFVKLDVKVKDTAEHEEAVVRELTVAKYPINVQIVPESGKIVTGIQNIIYIMTTDPTGRGIATHNLINFDGQGFTVDTDNNGLGAFTVDPSADSTLVFDVTSQTDGQSVNATIDLSDDDERARILLRTEKAIYSVGDTMTIDIFTPEVTARRAFLDIIRDRQTLLTRGVDMLDGHGRYILDLGNDMEGTLFVEAYYISLATQTASDIFRDKKIVYVNPALGIEVTATMDKGEYLPGDTAKIEFQVIPQQTAALGITIVDEAVFALQENRPGLLKVYFNMEADIMQPRFWPLLFPFEEALTSEDPDDEIQEITEVAFAMAREPDDPGLDESSYPNLVQRMKEKLVSRIDKDAEKVAKDLGDLGVYSEYSYKRALEQGKIKTYEDPWGHPYTLNVGNNQVTLNSNGPDEISGTLDDISYTKGYEPVYKPYDGGYYGGYYGGGLYGGGFGGGYAAYGGGGYYGGGGGGYYTAAPTGGGTGGETVPEIKGGFLNPTVQDGQTTPDVPREETQEPRKVRRDFPETLLWEPSLITGPDGKASLDIDIADSITTWRLSITASNRDGNLGGGTDGITVFQDFFIDLDLPVTLTRNDEISMPVAVYNYLPGPQSVRIVLDTTQADPWFELMDTSEKYVNLESGEVTVVYFRMRAVRVGWHEMTVYGYGTAMSDAIARKIEVVPDGMEYHVNISDRMTGNETSHVLNIPYDAIDGASKILVKVYPGVFSQAVEGLDSLFKVPHGCFTQSTTITWPNVLVLEYMISTDQITPEIEMKAREYINLGYQRLLTFECPNGGFSWYGNEPGKPVLTAYGLMEFTDMARVQYVDPEMISRTRDWLLGKQQTDGTWPPDQVRELFNVLSNKLQATAYAVWALIHSGHPGNATGIVEAKDYIKANVDASQDNYTLALCAHALLEENPTDAKGLAILDRLEAKRVVVEDTVYWGSDEPSFTYSRGANLAIETTAMIAWAMIKANWRYPQSIEGAINYIIQHKDAFGRWGQTQATVLSLRVLMLALSGQMQDMDAELIVSINGEILDKEDLPILKINPVDSRVLRLIDLRPYTVEGDNNVGISLIGAGSLLYQIVGTYYMPWTEVTLPPDPQLTIDLRYDRTNLTLDDTILCTVTVTNTLPDSITQLGMVDLGIPPGFNIFWEDFVKAQEDGKIFKYESTNRQLTLYLYPIPYGEPLVMSYRLQAKYPLKVSTPKSTAYDYYNPDQKDETKPVVITVTD